MFGKTSLIVKTGASLLAVLQPSFAEPQHPCIYVPEMIERLRHMSQDTALSAEIRSDVDDLMRVADEAGDGIIQEGKNLERLYGLVANLQRNVQELGQKGESNSVLILELQQQRGGLQRQLIYAQDQHEADESRIEAVHRELDATRFERDTTLQKLSVSEQKRGAAEQELQAVAQRASATKDELEAAKQEIARFKAMLGQ